MSGAALALALPTIRRHVGSLAWRLGVDPLEVETGTLGELWAKMERGDLAAGELGAGLLYGYARNVARRCRAGVQRRGSVPLERLEHALPAPGSPLEDLEREERAAAVRRAVEALPADARRFVVLHFFEGLDLREVADREGANFYQVQQTIDRSLLELAGSLAAHREGRGGGGP